MTTERTPCPEPGLYEVPEAFYRAWDAVNWSTLKEMAKTPRHYRHAATSTSSDQTDAQAQGTLFHALLLEPDAAKTRFIVAPDTYPSESSTGRGDNKVVTKTDKPWNGNATYCKEWLAEQSAQGRVVCKPYELHAGRAMAESVLEIPDAVTFLRGAQTEVAVVWDDPQTGLRCKALLDILNSGQLGDVKSSSKPLDWETFARTVKFWGYAGQMAFYRDGLNAVLALLGEALPDVPMARFICAETAPPYAAAVYDLFDSPDSISHDWFVHGRNLYHSYLQQVAYCIKHNRWPSWNQSDIDQPAEAMELAIPDYLKLEGNL